MVTRDEYTKAMKDIIMYNSLTDKQINSLSDKQLIEWESKVLKAAKIKNEYLNQLKKKDV
jgi:hypothetical protein